MHSTLRFGARRPSLAAAAAVALFAFVGASAADATTPPDSTSPEATAASDTSGSSPATTVGDTAADSGTTAPGDTAQPESPATADPCATRTAMPMPPMGPPDTAATSASTPASGSTPASASADVNASAEPTAFEVTLTETSIDGLPGDLAAGVADVTLTDETEASGGEVNFTLVEPGTDPQTFVSGLAALFSGGPFPDFFLNTSGLTGSGMVTLDEGEYIVWIDLASNAERASTPEDIVTATMTVGPGDNRAVIPDTNDQIRSGDYLFDADIAACDSTLTFTNSSDNQFHHVVVVDFGTQDPALVEAKLPEVINSDEAAPPPEGLDFAQVNFDFASSGVFGPGASGTFVAEFEPGNTYAVLCFITDREGGMPHAVQHQMYDVFQVEAD